MAGSSLRYFLYGAAPMSVEKLKRAIEVFGPVMMDGYGQTEAPMSISSLTPGEYFAAECAKNQQHSVHNPWSQFRKPFTIDEVLAGCRVSRKLRSRFTS